MTLRIASLLFLAATLSPAASPYPEKTPATPANATLQQYWELKSAQVHEQHSLDGIKTADQWTSQKDEARRQLREMLGLDPLPAKTDLKPVITGEVKGDGYRVEKLHFQSMPGL